MWIIFNRQNHFYSWLHKIRIQSVTCITRVIIGNRKQNEENKENKLI